MEMRDKKISKEEYTQVCLRVYKEEIFFIEHNVYLDEFEKYLAYKVVNEYFRSRNNFAKKYQAWAKELKISTGNRKKKLENETHDDSEITLMYMLYEKGIKKPDDKLLEIQRQELHLRRSLMEAKHKTVKPLRRAYERREKAGAAFFRLVHQEATGELLGVNVCLSMGDFAMDYERRNHEFSYKKTI